MHRLICESLLDLSIYHFTNLSCMDTYWIISMLFPVLRNVMLLLKILGEKEGLLVNTCTQINILLLSLTQHLVNMYKT